MVPPLCDVSNAARPEPSPRKRSYETFSSDDDVEHQGADSVDRPIGESLSDKENDDDDIAPADRMDCTPIDAVPDLVDPPSSPLSIPPSPEPTMDVDSTSSAQDAATPSASATPSKASNTAKAKSPKSAAGKKTGPPAKKPRLTFQEKLAEKQAKEAAEAVKKAEKEAARLEKEAAKMKKATELEAAKQERDAAKAKKAAEAEEKRVKAEQKKAEKMAKEAELIKKACNLQVEKMLMANFLKPKPKPVKTEKTDVDMKDGPSNSPKSAYDKLFRPFFVKANVTMAKQPFEMDEETREAKSKILEGYLDGSREHVPKKLSDDVLDTLQIPFRAPRGRVYPSVKDIMAKHHGASMSTAIDLTADSHSQTLKALESVPVKSLKFREDVRPPYVGTISGLPAGLSSLRKVARNPTGKIVPTLDYDYDSEAEWQEDEGEDVDLDDMDDEEIDQDEEMDDFLDDSEDVGPARPAFSGGMEPESTGLCWENRKRLNDTTKTYKFRMEFILESLDHHSGIDPFTDSYWKPARATSPAPKAASGTSPASNNASPGQPSAVPINALQALTKRPGPPKRPVPPAAEKEFKEFLRSRTNIGKAGVVAVFWAEHPELTKAALSALFDDLTEPDAGKKTKGRHWKLKDDVQTVAS